MSDLGPSDDAMAQLAEDVGRALLRFADTLRQERQAVEATRRSDGRTRGALQERVLALEGLAAQGGMSAAEVAEPLAVAPSNATRALNALADRGDLEVIEGERPMRWRFPA
ncbi:hypothetical protein ACFUC1_08985 [Pedococcus sp. NPDC057267]|uniref:hypothetical protein n=1 Tax=Pedococcus sp. NPDC057267 TaxID=3346077 RepID=UPI0036272499